MIVLNSVNVPVVQHRKNGGRETQPMLWTFTCNGAGHASGPVDGAKLAMMFVGPLSPRRRAVGGKAEGWFPVLTMLVPIRLFGMGTPGSTMSVMGWFASTFAGSFGVVSITRPGSAPVAAGALTGAPATLVKPASSNFCRAASKVIAGVVTM